MEPLIANARRPWAQLRSGRFQRGPLAPFKGLLILAALDAGAKERGLAVSAQDGGPALSLVYLLAAFGVIALSFLGHSRGALPFGAALTLALLGCMAISAVRQGCGRRIGKLAGAVVALGGTSIGPLRGRAAIGSLARRKVSCMGAACASRIRCAIRCAPRPSPEVSRRK